VLHMVVSPFLQNATHESLPSAVSTSIELWQREEVRHISVLFHGSELKGKDASTADALFISSESISVAICSHTRGSFSIS